MRKIMLAVLLVAAGALALGCGTGGDRAKGDVGQTRPGGATGGEQGGAGGTGSDGDVTSRDANRFQTIYFDFNKYNLRDDARAALDANADLMRDNPDLGILIEGHCDERGTDEYNLALGERRAQAARDYLVRLGIDASRVSVTSYGEARPVAPGHDEESWQLNRRGEFVPR